jgi:hypothetical protein
LCFTEITQIIAEIVSLLFSIVLIHSALIEFPTFENILPDIDVIKVTMADVLGALGYEFGCVWIFYDFM